jgi:hypothetical protein
MVLDLPVRKVKLVRRSFGRCTVGIGVVLGSKIPHDKGKGGRHVDVNLSAP